MEVIKIVFMGFGNVGQALARLLIERRDFVNKKYNVDFIVTRYIYKTTWRCHKFPRSGY